MEKIKLAGEEFVRKILSGERDFSGIELKQCNLKQLAGFDQLYGYLRRQDFKDSPLDFSKSWFQYVTFGNVNHVSYPIPSGLNFSFVNGDDSWFVDSDLTYLNFENSSLRNVFFDNSNLQYVNFQSVDAHNTSFYGARLIWTDFRNVKNIETVRGIEQAYLWNVIVREEGMERKALEKIVSERPNFSVDNGSNPLID